MMKKYLAAAVFLAFCGCYASSGSEHQQDASGAPDAADTAAHDDALPDAATPDAVPDHGPDAAPDAEPAGPYVLHEWGVISRGEREMSAHGPAPEGMGDTVDKPVIYLYTDEVMSSLDIKVTFASGLADETWPMLPAGPVLEWNDLHVEPGPCETSPFPYPWDQPICEICNLASCVVEEADCITFLSAEGVETRSKLLFYAGPVEDYEPPLVGEAVFLLTYGEPLVEMNVRNRSGWDIKDIWLIYRDVPDTCPEPWMPCPVLSASLAYTFVEKIPQEEDFSAVLPVRFYEAPVDEEGIPTGDLPLPEEWLEMDKKLLEKLVERGLTDAEAGAFVANWVQAFFGILGDGSYYVEPLYSDGAFAIYFMDREDYDAQFRLDADPAPRQSVRVGMIYDKLPTFNE
jgi:hypothetical protein